MRRLENEDEDKFWEAWVKDDLIFCYRFGKIGSSGHTKLKKFKTKAEAEAELERWVQQKIEEGYVDPGAEEEEDEESEDEESSEEESDESDGDGEESEDEADDDDDDDDDEAESDADDEEASEDEESEDEAEEEEEESEDDEDEDEDEEKDEDEGEDGDSDDDDDDDDEGGGRRAKPAKAPAPPRRVVITEEVAEAPEAPKLPIRVAVGNATAQRVAFATKTLDALKSSVGDRSWKVRRRARTARAALAKLGGVDIGKHAALSSALDDAMGFVIAPKKKLSLAHALEVLRVVDAGTFAKVVTRWRTKMLDGKDATTIGAMAAALAAIPDPEVAVWIGLALADRRLSDASFKKWLSSLKPFLDEALAKGGSSKAKLAKALKPGTDTVLAARIAEVIS